MTTNETTALAVTDTRASQKKALEPDEVIASGLDLVYRPSSTARAVYTGTATSTKQHGAMLRDAVMRHAEQFEEWPSFVRELFARLFDEDGTVPVPDDQRSAWGAQAMGALEAQADWPELREAAQISRVVAADATARLAAAVSAAMNLDKVKTDEETRRDPRQVMRDAQAVANLLAQAGATEEQVEQVMGEAAEAAAKAVAMRRGMDAQAERARPAIAMAVRNVTKEAQATAAAVGISVALGFSREGPGSLEEESPDLLRDLRLDPRMRDILRHAGRFNDAAAGAMAKADGRCDVVGVRPTGDLARLTARAKAELADPGLIGLVAMRDLADHAAQGWEQRDRLPKNKGDAALLVDRSGSMSGEREARARALAVASLVSLVQQGRRVLACSFAGEGDVDTAAAMHGNPKAIAAAIRVLCRRAGGGTDVDGAVARCTTEMARFPGGMREPDLLVLTDGAFDRIAQPVLDALGEARLFGVLVDVGSHEIANHPEFDRMWSVMGNITDDTAGEVIATVRAPKGGV